MQGAVEDRELFGGISGPNRVGHQDRQHPDEGVRVVDALLLRDDRRCVRTQPAQHFRVGLRDSCFVWGTGYLQADAEPEFLVAEHAVCEPEEVIGGAVPAAVRDSAILQQGQH